MKTKYLICFILFFGVNITLKSQENKISIQSGCFYPGTQFNNAQLGFLGGFDFTHILKNKMTLSSHFSAGRSKYHEEELTNVPPEWQEISKTNADIYLYNIGLLLGREFKLSEVWNFWLQGGMALSLINKQEIPLALFNTDIKNPTYQYSVNETGFTFPLQASINYRLSNSIEIGILGGFYVPNPIIFRLGAQVNIMF